MECAPLRLTAPPPPEAECLFFLCKLGIHGVWMASLSVLLWVDIWFSSSPRDFVIVFAVRSTSVISDTQATW